MTVMIATLVTCNEYLYGNSCQTLHPLPFQIPGGDVAGVVQEADEGSQVCVVHVEQHPTGGSKHPC